MKGRVSAEKLASVIDILTGAKVYASAIRNLMGVFKKRAKATIKREVQKFVTNCFKKNEKLGRYLGAYLLDKIHNSIQRQVDFLLNNKVINLLIQCTTFGGIIALMGDAVVDRKVDDYLRFKK